MGVVVQLVRVKSEVVQADNCWVIRGKNVQVLVSASTLEEAKAEFSAAVVSYFEGLNARNILDDYKRAHPRDVLKIQIPQVGVCAGPLTAKTSCRTSAPLRMELPMLVGSSS